MRAVAGVALLVSRMVHFTFCSALFDITPRQSVRLPFVRSLAFACLGAMALTLFSTMALIPDDGPNNDLLTRGWRCPKLSVV